MNHFKLTLIGARNLMGSSFEQPLEPATFFVGPNMAGKTTRTNAIRLLLVGFLPEIGKKNDAIFSLSSGRDLAVWGILRDETGKEFPISRRWYVKEDSIKSEKRIPPELGDESLLETMLNADSWFGLSERDRVDWVFKNIGMPGEIKPDDVRAAIKGAIEADEAILSAPVLEKRAEIIASFFSIVDAGISDRENDDGPINGPAYLEAMLEEATEIAKNEREQAARMDKTVSGLAGLRAADAAPVDLTELDRSLAAIDLDIGKLRDEMATKKAEARAQDANTERRERLGRELARKPSLEANLSAARAHTVAQKAEIEVIKTTLDQMPVPDISQVEELRTEERELGQALGRAESDLSTVTSSISRNEAELGEVGGKQKCPYCGATGDGWKALKTAEINSALAGLRAKRQQLESHVSTLKTSATAIRQRIYSLVNATNKRTEVADKLRNANVYLLEAIEGERKASDAINLLAGKEGELAAIPAFNPEIASAYASLNTSLTKKQEERAAIEAKRRAALGRQEEIKRLAQAEEAREEAKIAERIAKVAAEAIRTAKAKLVAAAFGPILEAANEFSAGLIKRPVAFNPDKNEVGSWRDGLWVGPKTHSGIEQLFIYAGIQAALASKSRVRVMVLDEMLRAQNTKELPAFDLLIAACKRAVKSGMVDNFVGVIPADPETYSSLAEKDCLVVSVRG